MPPFVMTDSHLPPAVFQPADAVVLPLSFDVSPLVREVDALTGAPWLTHFSTGYHDGGWTGISLMAADGDGSSLYATGAAPAAPTAGAGACPQLLAAIGRLKCPIKSARLLRLAPGSVILEHADANLRWRVGEARLQAALRDCIDLDAMLALAVSLGQHHALHFSIEDMGSHLPSLTREQHVRWLRALVFALGQTPGHERHLVIKLDARHVLQHELLSAAFPGVPWLSIYRDPIEIAVSQFEQRANYMMPGLQAALTRWAPIAEALAMGKESHIARRLGKFLQPERRCANTGLRAR